MNIEGILDVILQFINVIEALARILGFNLPFFNTDD
jgi:hypothetical protein